MYHLVLALIHFMKYIWLLTLLTIALTSAASGFRFKHIEATDGLSDNKVNVILKDREGFVWIGSASGLNRFDGYELKAFLHNGDDSTSIINNYINDIKEAPDGRLWIKAGREYIIYNTVTDRFNNDISGELSAAGIRGTPALAAADGKAMWLYVRGEGVYRLRDGKARRVDITDSNGREITDMEPLGGTGNTALIDKTGHLTLVDSIGGIVTASDHITRQAPFSAELFLYADSDGLLWIYGTSGVWVLDTHSCEWIHSQLPPSIEPRAIRAVAQDDNGRIWLGLDNEGVAVLDKNGGVMRLVNNPSDIYSLGNNSVTSLLADDNGTMWVGTQKKGVSMYNESEFKFDLVPMPDVNCITKDGNTGKYWIGTDSNGLMRWDSVTGKLTACPDPADGDRPGAIAALHTRRDGSLWIGTFNSGLKRYRNGRFRTYTTADGLPSDNIWAIDENPDGSLWLGTLGRGLVLMRPDGGVITTYTTANSPLESDYIISFARGRDGKLYTGTSSGIAAVDPVTRKISPVDGTRDGDKRLAMQEITQLFTDSRGLIWIGMRDGLAVLDLKHDSIYDITVLPDYPRKYILGIAEDTARNLWVSVDGSLINIIVDTDLNNSGYSFTSHHYSGKDGLQNSTFNQRSMTCLHNGDIVVGGLYGLNIVSPGNIHYNLSRPKVIFTGLTLLGGREVKVGDRYDGKVILQQTLNHTEKVSLDYRHNSFTVYFATDNHILPEHTTYYYKLEGLHDEWLKCPAGMHHATFTNLSPGKYRIVVRAVNNDGVEGDSESVLDIVVTPPVWATVWAKILYVMLAIGATVLLIVALRRHERRRYIERQRDEMARKQEELNQMKFKFYTNVSHELRTPLTLIISPLESMMKENTDEATKKRLSTMHTNAVRLLHLVNQLLDFRKNEIAGLSFNGATGDVVSFMRNAFNTFSEIAEKKQLSLTFNTSIDSLEMTFDADKLGKAFTNLLSNATKFTPAGGKVEVELSLADKMLRIKVADTGCGVKDEEKGLIFERFYQSAANQAGNGGSGIGLSLVKEYARLHDGDVKVEDTPGGGATFIMDIPVRQSPAAETQPDSGLQQRFPKSAAGREKPVALLVDDNHDLLEFMRDELSADFDLLTASDGVEALDILARDKADIVVTDLMMPRLDGIELCRKIKSDTATLDIPVIVVTAKQDVQSVVEGLTMGADDYVTKPFNSDVLRLRMKRLVELRKKGAKRSLIVPEPQAVKITSLDEKLIERAVKYVEDNISRSDLSVEELSKELGMSRVHLYKKILHITGKTPIEFIRVLRLKRAAQYLRESQLNVSEIAYKLGFNNPKYFSKYFQEEYGISPSEYQKREGI